MAYLNSDDVLLPRTLAAVANFFQARPDVDIVYGHRVFIDSDGLEIGRAVLPARPRHTNADHGGALTQENGRTGRHGVR